MDRQKQIFEKLGFGPFLANLTTILFLPRKEKGDVFYASANYKVQEPNYTRPDDHRNYFEHDVIMTVVHCGERIDKGRTRRKIVSKFVVSIEIKTSVDDIWKSLLRQLVQRYRSHPRKEVIGLVDADTGQVVVLPQYQDFQKDRCDRLLARCYTSEHRYPFCCGDVEPYGIHRVMENDSPAPEWTDCGGLRVNTAYLNLLTR